MSDWLKNILEDAEQRAAARPAWAKSEYAQSEIARLRGETKTTTAAIATATVATTPESALKKL
jgi:hypothetical protein